MILFYIECALLDATSTSPGTCPSSLLEWSLHWMSVIPVLQQRWWPLLNTLKMYIYIYILEIIITFTPLNGM